MSETPENRIKRLSMRSWRRGMKEMDLILGAFADAKLAAASDDFMTAYEALLDENDQELYKWVSGTVAPPTAHGPVVAEIAHFHGIDR